MHEEFIREDYDSSLAHLLEECGEVVQIIGKIYRFGLYSYNPLVPESDQKSNVALLHEEIEDLQAAIGRYYNAYVTEITGREILNDLKELTEK